MLPILESILVIKRQEREAEAPFIEMILDECCRAGLTEAKAPEFRKQVEQAVLWWKTKNKWKRALTVDEPKALRMIVRYLKNPNKLAIQDDSV